MEILILITFSILAVLLTSLGTMYDMKKDAGSKWAAALMLVWAGLLLASCFIRVMQ